MRSITTNEITNVVSLINKARELKTAHSLSITALLQHQRVASLLYDKLLNEVDYESHSNIINPLENACDIFDMLIEEHQHNEYMKKVGVLWGNGKYDTQSDEIKRSK
jgi:hypothetical protein